MTFFVTEANSQTTSSDELKASSWAPTVNYDLSDDGTEYVVNWGIDTAWLWSWWPLRATNHMQECVSVGRVTLDPRVSGNYSALAAEQSERLDTQCSWLKKSGVRKLMLLAGNASGSTWQTSYRNAFVKDIELAVKYLQAKGYEVMAISHFNEPDYGANLAPGPEEMATVARLIHQNATLKNIPVCGPSCLNPDYANSWWPIMQNDIDIGNTHQLAGTFDNFAGFYQAVNNSGKKSAGDEMHNINDALIGMYYGNMYIGIWWSDYGGYTRAELGRATQDGRLITYKENRGAWTSTAVFKRKSQELAEAFLGTSERQAGESAYCFVSQDRLAYYDGNGPFYDYTHQTKGGTGYTQGQTNSETVVEITTGEDVPLAPLNGVFKIVNKATGKLLTASAASSGAEISQKNDGGRNQTWKLTPLAKEQAGDFAYVTVTAAENNDLFLDANKYDGNNGAKVLLYAGGGNECERWHFRYMGNGYYVITNHDSGLSLEGSSNNSNSNTTAVVQWARTGSDRQLWKITPAEGNVDAEAPEAPTGLKAESLSGAVKLSWNQNSEKDIYAYAVYRFNEKAQIWETIARNVKQTEFIDNSCKKQTNLKYRVRAIDNAWNISQPSQTIEANTSYEKALIAHWMLDANFDDKTENKLKIAATEEEIDNSGAHAGAKLDGSNYLALPYHIADMKEMTFAAWVKMEQNNAWQRIFDFGKNNQNYLFLTNSNGNVMRFEICKDGQKQGLDGTRKMPTSWNHVAVTTKKNHTAIYINGNLEAQTEDITFTPQDVCPMLSFIGRSMFDADPLIKATIGDVRIYNYAMASQEARELYYDAVVEPALELLEMPMYSQYKDNLRAAVDNVIEAMKGSDEKDIASAVTAMNTAMNSARTSANRYEKLGEALKWSANLAETYPQQDEDAKAKYQAEYQEVYQKYLDGEYTNIAVTTTAVYELQAITNAYLMEDAVKNANEKNPVDISHLVNNSEFDDNSAEGWNLTTSTSNYKGNVDFKCIEISEKTFNLSQTLYGMPSGKYRVSTQAFYRNGPNTNAASTDVYALLYLGSEKMEITPISKGANNSTSDGTWYAYANNKQVPDDIEAAAAAFNKLNRYKPLVINGQNTMTADYDANENDKLTFGIRKTKQVSNDWTVINFIKLYYLGNENADPINNIFDDNEYSDNQWFTLSGMRIDKPIKKGVYINNGKKLIIK